MRFRVVFLVAFAAVLCPASAMTPVASAASPRTLALPPRLGLGVTAAPDATGLTGWMPQSGVAWDYTRRSAGWLLFRVAYQAQDADHLSNVSRSIRVDWI